MKNIKTKLALIGVLVIIGIGMILTAHFTGLIDNKQESSEHAKDKGIAIVLNPTQKIQEQETKVNVSKAAKEADADTNEIIEEESTEAWFDDGKKDESYGLDDETMKAKEMENIKRGVGYEGVEATGGKGTSGSSGDENYSLTGASSAALALPAPVPPPLPTSNAPPSIDSLKQTIYQNSMSVVVVNDGQVVSNETVDIE